MRQDKNRSISALFEASLLILTVAAFLFYDPFRINYKAADFLRLKFPIFTREPKLLFYTYMYMGSFIAKAFALVVIGALLLARREDIKDALAIRPPYSKKWFDYILPFVILSTLIRIYYFLNPLLPNLPVRFVFPSAMIIGNAIIITSVVIVAPITEEVIFRGYLFDAFMRNFRLRASVILTSILFALAHARQLEFETVPTLIILALGAVFAILRHRTKSLLVPIAFHAIYNLVYIVLGALNFFLVGY